MSRNPHHPEGILPAMRLASFQKSWLALLRRKYPSLRGAHMDILQEAVIGLLDWAKEQDRTIQEAELYKVGTTILARRASDFFRREITNWAAQNTVPIDTAHGDESPTSNPPLEALQHRRLLVSLLRILGQMPSDDRILLLEKGGFAASGREDGPATNSERKRLSRLRQLLKEKLQEELDDWPRG